jgi:cytochrome c heme-lyase
MGQTTSTPSPAPSSSVETKPTQHSPAPPSQHTLVKCPIDHNGLASGSGSGSPSSSHPSCPPHPSGPAKCPIDHGKTGELNPLNQIPTLAQERAPGQTSELPLEREVSSIPRAKDSSKWEYPSAQQFYNALVRKGWETPEEHVQTMVDIHNFLNEEAWQEILKWEPPYVPFFLSASFGFIDLILLCVSVGTRTHTSPSSEENLASYHQKPAC